MGIDFSHSDASWSYSGFHRFRSRLAESAGFNISDMDGFGGNKSFNEIGDDIVPFINHSDCDGELTVEECRKIAPRLLELLTTWPDEYAYDKRQGLLLLRVC